jgi:hypothetical protein
MLEEKKPAFDGERGSQCNDRFITTELPNRSVMMRRRYGLQMPLVAGLTL